MKMLQVLDDAFEEEERERGIPESWIEASRDFCFVCHCGLRHEVGRDPATRVELKILKQFQDEIRSALSLFSLQYACMEIKDYYEDHVRSTIRTTMKPTFTLVNIAKHILKHDVTPQNISDMDIQTHAVIMGKLRAELLTSEGLVDRNALKSYIHTSSNFNRFYGVTAKQKVHTL